jgi:hypothetical protein
MAEPANPSHEETGALPTHSTFKGVLVSGHIQEIVGDLVGGNKITINFGNPEFEEKLFALIQSRDASSIALSALATNLIALRLSTFFVDIMRLIYVTNGHRVKNANAHLRAHFVERAERNSEQFNTIMRQYANAQLDGAFLRNVNAVERRNTWALAHFASANPLARDSRRLFREMKNGAGPMYEVLSAADAKGVSSTVALVNEIGIGLLHSYSSPAGFAKVDEIAMLRFAIQTEALRRLQEDAPDQIFSIDDDVEGNFSPLYVIIDQWLLDCCKPWN